MSRMHLREKKQSKAKGTEILRLLRNVRRIERVGMLLRCLSVIENVTFLIELNQRHLPELQLPRRKRDAPVSFIGLVISTINMLSGRDELHLVNKH
ncbi:hypothetical protein BDL97_14G000500 [Sphagnum fallax]|nr:hypothetical protein BDL97_14G000500 [Sphagnum fallax]